VNKHFIINMASGIAKENRWTEKEVLSLLIESKIPSWWDSDIHFITYDLLGYLFQNCHKVRGNRDDLVPSALAVLYSNFSSDNFELPQTFPTTLPSSFKNVRRKVNKYLQKPVNDRFAKYCDFYIMRAIFSFFCDSIPKDCHPFSLKRVLSSLLKRKQKFSNRIDEMNILLNEKFVYVVPNNSVSSNDILNSEITFQKICLEERMELEKSLEKCEKEVSVLVNKLVLSEEKLSSLSFSAKQNEKELLFLSSENSKLQNELAASLQKISLYSPNNVKRRLKRREEKIITLSDQNEKLRQELLELSSREKNHLSNNLELSSSLNSLNKKLSDALVAKTKAQKLKFYYKSICLKNDSTLSFDNQITELKNRISILEVEKIEMQSKLDSFLELDVIVSKENGRYTDDIRAVYHPLPLLS